MIEATEELHARLLLGDVQSMIILVEVQGSTLPQLACLGRFGTDPFRALAALIRAQRHVHRTMEHEADVTDFATG